MVEAAERSGALTPGGTLIEPTSGNTGVGLALIAAVRGYRVILTMPETMSVERRRLLAAYGAQIVLTPGTEGMAGAIARAEELRAVTPGAVILGQFENADNARAHYQTTGPEVWQATEGTLAAFVAGVGTGGTLTGTGRYLKERNPAIHLVAVEPADSAVLSGGPARPHALQGIGAGFAPKVLDRTLIDEVMPVGADDARRTARAAAAKEGLLTGISSGAALWAAIELAKRPAFAGRTIVVLLPDTGERYLSTELFA
jgi:cysteine synthase A